MKPYSRLFLFIICVLPFDAIAFSQTPNDSLSLDQAIAKVVSGNPSVRELSSSVGATTARVSQSEDPRYPTAEVVGSYTRLGPASQFDLPGLGSLKLYPLDNYDAHVAVHETVYDFDRTSQSINLAQSQVTIASDRVDLMKRDLAFQTARSFYAILFLRKSIDVQNSQIDALNQHLETVKKKVASGTATDFDVLTTQVRLAAARNVLDDLQDRLTKEEISLRRLAGILPTQELHLKGDFASEAVPLNLDSLTQSGLANSIDMKTADDAILTRQIQSRSASLGDKPSVGVTFAYGFKNGFFPDIDVFRGNFAAALDVKVPIFEGRRTMGSVEEADANVDAAENHRADVESHVRADVAQAVADLRSAAERLQTSELDVQQASSAVSLAKVRFDAGVITNLDLLDAQTGLQEARLSNLRALYNFVISRFDLRRAVGEKIW